MTQEEVAQKLLDAIGFMVALSQTLALSSSERANYANAAKAFAEAYEKLVPAFSMPQLLTTLSGNTVTHNI